MSDKATDKGQSASPTKQAVREQSNVGAPGKRTRSQLLEQSTDEAAPTMSWSERRARNLAEQPPAAGGDPLPHREMMERAFATDFSDVNVRLGASAEMESVGARATTVGKNVTFGMTNPDPGLVAHELTHVVQQARGGMTAQAKSIEPDHRDALEAEADAVGERVASGQPAGPIHGTAPAVVLRDGPDKDKLPDPVLMQVLGDRFTLRFRRDEKHFYCDVTYEGDLQVSAPFMKEKTSTFKAQLEDRTRKLNATVTKRETSQITIDVYGDGLTTAKLTITSEPRGNTRDHFMRWMVGAQGYGSMKTVSVTGNNSTSGGTDSPGESSSESISFTAVDPFHLSAVRYGDSNSVAVTLSAGEGAMAANPQTFQVPVEGSLDKVAPKIVTNDGRNIEVDVNGDGKVDFKLVHTAKSLRKSADGTSEIRDHFFRRFDKDGVLVGDRDHGMLFAFAGPVKAIPELQNEDSNAPEVDKEPPASRDPSQEDTIGELPKAVRTGGNLIEFRIDGDGDRTKELVLRFKGIPPTDETSKSGQIRIDMIQLSSNASGKYQTKTYDTTADAAKNLEPRMTQVADGFNPAVIQVLSGVKSIYGQPVDMKVFPPTSDKQAGTRSYVVEFAGQRISYTFPEETADANPLVKSATAKANAGNVARFEVVLGEFGDKFWIMLEHQPGGKSVFSIAAVNPDGPAAARGVPLVGGAAAITSFNQVDGGPTNFAIDTNKDGKADIKIFDGISAPTLLKKPYSTPEQERDHVITATGPVLPGAQKWTFYVRDGKFWQSMTTDFGGKTANRDAAAAAGALDTMDQQAIESQTTDGDGNVVSKGDIGQVMSRIAGALAANRLKAKQAGLISDKLFGAWKDLSENLITLGPQIGASKVDPALQATAATNAGIFYAELTKATKHTETTSKVNARGYRSTTKSNKYTGTRVVDSNYSASGTFGPGVRLQSEIKRGEWDAAQADFDALVGGLDQWIADQQKDGSREQNEQKYLLGMQKQMSAIKDKPGIKRVFASFQPDKSYNTNTREWGLIPLMLYTWKEDGKWWLKDITNPTGKTFLDRVSANDDDKHPPASIFEQLDYARHFPKGIIHYQLPDGPGGRVVTTERKEWYEFLQWVGLGLAVIGFSLATFGTGTVAATAAAVAFAASGVASAVYAGGDLYERAKHGDLEPAAVVINVATIVAGILTAGAAISGRIVAAAAQADMAAKAGVSGAAAWSGAAARIAQVASKVYVPAVGGAVAADVVNVLAMGVEIAGQIQKVKDGPGSESDKSAAIAMLISQGLIMGGITILSIKGSMPELRGGHPTIVIDTMNGIPVARAGGVRMKSGKINVSGDNPDAHAASRWQSHQLEEAGEIKGTAGDPARAMLDDEEFMKWYRRWMEQPKKVEFEGGAVPNRKPKVVEFTGPKGEPMPDAIRKRLQAFVDNPRTGIDLYEAAFHNADELRKVKKAIEDAGGDLHVDPGNPSWLEHRGKIVKALGGDANAEAMVRRFEAARGVRDFDQFVKEHEQLNKLVPDIELDRVQKLFDDFEVYVTGSATQPGKPLAKTIDDLDVFVVVPAGTEAELMQAIEARASGFAVHPDPQFLKTHGLPADHTIGLDVKVMTPEQFFGMTTTHPGFKPTAGGGKTPRTPLRFHKIGDGTFARVSQALKEGKPVAPGDMAELRRLIASGQLDPKTLPPALQETLPKQAGYTPETVRQWADDLINSNPNKMSQEAIDADLKAFTERKQAVAALYERAKTDPSVLPEGITFEQLELAVKGDPKTGARVPLNFSVRGGKLSTNIEEAKALFAEFQADLRAVFDAEGITDAVVVQLGSGTTGWSSAPKKTGKPWTPKSDVDFAIFSDQALEQAMRQGAKVNPKNQQAGQYTTLKNGTADGTGFADTSLGQRLHKLEKKWNERIYGDPDVDGFDFKMNLASDKPFRTAVPILQVQKPQIVPLTQATKGGHTRAGIIEGRSPYFGLSVKDPRYILPPDVPGRREFHITIFSPPELAGLSDAARAKLAGGLDIKGAPVSGNVTTKDIAGTPVYSLEITWPEAQALRAKHGLGAKELHVSLSGGIGDAVARRGAGGGAGTGGN